MMNLKMHIKLKPSLLTLLFLMVLDVSLSWGQDPQFTQFYAAPLYLSPSFAGSNNDTRVTVNCRDQWLRLPGDYVTYAVSVDHYIEKYRSGVGLLFFRDEAAGGLLNTTNIGFNYNYNFSVTRKWHLSPGIQAYYYIKDINYNKLVFSDQISRDGITPVSIEMQELATRGPVRHMDVTTSLLAFSDMYWAGFTLDHMLSFNRMLNSSTGYLPVRLSVYGGAKFFLSNRLRKRNQESLTGAFNFMSQSQYKYLDLGAYYTRAPMQFGVWYRGIPLFGDNPNIGALTLQFGYKVNDITIGYSYDYTLGSLMTKTGGAHEVSLSYDITGNTRRKKMRMIPCPVIQ